MTRRPPEELIQPDIVFERILRIVFFLFLSILGLSSLLMIMGYDQLHMHYLCLRMTAWGLLPYRDAYDFQFYGIYLYHLLIQTLFGYSDLGFRIFDLVNSIVVCISLYYFLKKLVPRIHDATTYLILILWTAYYYGLGWWWTGQREIFLLPYILWSFYFYKKAADDGKWFNALVSGLLSGFAFFIKPFAGLYLPLFVLIHLVCNYPYANPIKLRLKIAVLSGAGFLLTVSTFALHLQSLGILKNFLNDSMMLAIEFKRIGFPFLTNLYHVFFQYGPEINAYYILIYKVFYAAPIFISIIFILSKIVKKNFRDYFAISFLFITSLTLIIIQKNGNVTNHHIPLICFKSIAAILCIREWYDKLISFSSVKRHISNTTLQRLSKLVLSMTVIFLSIPPFIFGFDEYTRNYVMGKITLDRLQSTKYPQKIDEDNVVKYIKNESGIDLGKDRILNFNFSPYVPYHARANTMDKFIDNSFFYMIPRDSVLYKRLYNEFIDAFRAKPPAMIIVIKNDTTWSTRTCFNDWTNSYNELMKIDAIKKQIKEKYRVAMENDSLVVFQLKKI